MYSLSFSPCVTCGCCSTWFFFFKHKTAYEMRISDWSSDVCSSDLIWSISREDHDAFALESHRRAAVATDAGYFTAEIAPVDIARLAEPGSEITVATLAQDETIRRESTPEKLARDRKSTRLNSSH